MLLSLLYNYVSTPTLSNLSLNLNQSKVRACISKSKYFRKKCLCVFDLSYMGRLIQFKSV